jgi:hypothetical protein
MRIEVAATALLIALSALALGACGSDDFGDGEEDSLSVDDCVTAVDAESNLQIEKVDCEDSSADYSITAVGASNDELGACSFGVDLGDQVVCLDEVGSTADPIAEAEEQLDYATLEPGDCTDATVEDSEPTKVLPCDDLDARSEVIGQASDPLDCEGDVAAQRNGIVVCMQSRRSADAAKG